MGMEDVCEGRPAYCEAGGVVPVGGGVAVGGIGVALGSIVLVGSGVELGIGVAVSNSMLMMVAVITAVLVGTFGTQSFCPTKMVVDPPRQLACCSWETVVRYNWLILNNVSPL